MMDLDVLFEGWATVHWRGLDYGKGLGWRTHLTVHCSVFHGLSLHVGNICEWKRSRLFRVDAVISDLCNFDSYIKVRKRQGCAPGC